MVDDHKVTITVPGTETASRAEHHADIGRMMLYLLAVAARRPHRARRAKTKK